jgi:hypothetical protein
MWTLMAADRVTHLKRLRIKRESLSVKKKSGVRFQYLSEQISNPSENEKQPTRGTLTYSKGFTSHSEESSPA